MDVNGSVEGHQAVLAWLKLQPRRVPDSVDVLRTGRKPAIYRLCGVGRGGTAVIAKRTPAREAAIEEQLYVEVLPDLPMSSPRFYGLTPDGDGYVWLFMEDVGEERFSPTLPAHRTLAAAWLGQMHCAATRHEVAARLPDRGPRHYLEHLRIGRENIRRGLGNPLLTTEDRDLLKAVASQCDDLELRWAEIERFCADVPATLVHGDFRPKNVRVRTQDSQTCLLPIDWETAGWGVPAADLARSRGVVPVSQVDLDTYASIACEYWPGARDALGELVLVGSMFCRLAAISWRSLDLAYEWPQKAVASMHVYHEELRTLYREWSSGRHVPT